MPRVSRFGGTTGKGRHKPSTKAPPPPSTGAAPAAQLPPPSTAAPSSSQAQLPSTKAPPQYVPPAAQPPPPPPTDAPPAAQLPPLSTAAPSSSQVQLPSMQTFSTLIDAIPTTEAPSQAPATIQTWRQRRQRTKALSKAPVPSTDVSTSPQAPPPSIDAPSSSHVIPPSTDALPPSTQASSTLIDATSFTEAPSQAPAATQTRRRGRPRRQCTKDPSQAQQPLTNAPSSTQAPPSSIGAPSSSPVPTLTNASPSTKASLMLIDASITLIDARPSTEAPFHTPLVTQSTPSTEAPSQTPPVTQSTPSTESASQSHQVTQTQSRSRQSTKYWTVDVEDASGSTNKAHLKLKDLWELPDGTKVVLPLNDCKQPVGEAGGLLGQALGQLGANFAAFPICYESWSKVPLSYKEEVYNSKIKEKFIIDDDIVKKIIIKRIGEKWKENRSEVFHKYYDPNLSRVENYANHPPDINRDHWIQFIEYRLNPNTLKMCKRNAQSREKLLVVHRGGSKTLARKRYEMEVEGGEPVSRGKVFVATHASADGSYANDATKTICEKIIQVEHEGICSQAIAPNDSLGQVLGKEHSGRLRGLGLGPCKSQVFGPDSATFLRMQQEIIDLRAQLERETKTRLEFQNSVSRILQRVATPFMTAELAAILTPMYLKKLMFGE